MKGPSLRYDMRVLRVFCCDVCGRQVQTPGHVTSQTCLCSDPPKFMRPLDRPRTVSPDVSRFITPADPADMTDVDEIDETPYVLHVPIKPPPPARFANRRKLYDDTAATDEPAFGEGIVYDADGASESAVTKEAPAEALWNPGREESAEGSEKTAGDKGHSRSRRRGRGGEPDTARPPGGNTAPPARRPEARRPEASARPGAAPPGLRRDAGKATRNPNAESDGSDRSAPAGGDAKTGNESTSEHASSEQASSEHASSEHASSEQGEGRRRARRRGRRRGPRPEGGGA